MSILTSASVVMSCPPDLVSVATTFFHNISRAHNHKIVKDMENFSALEFGPIITMEKMR